MALKIIINSEDPQLINQILRLIKDETASYHLEQTEQQSSGELVEIMNQIAKNGKIKSIKEPVAWQKEVR
jgi:hypothetical protein